ncbi:protein kinase [Myxococcota bacterium]
MQNRILGNRYRLLTRIGQGGMGSVWLAEHVELGTKVAVKLMDSASAANLDGHGRFRREAQAAATLDSLNIVRVFDYGVDLTTPYIVMELLKGESLAQRLERVGRITLLSLAHVYIQMGRALTTAHETGIIHRDLKPDNIFLVPGDDGDTVKVIDFGVAKRTTLDPGQLVGVQTRTGALVGTPFYMSPEQASGSKHIDYRTDIWSLGVIAYECITGQRPYQSDSLGGLVLEICSGEARVPSRQAPVPAGFDAWYARCAARRAEERYVSAREAVAALWDLCTPAEEPLTSIRASVAAATFRVALAASNAIAGGEVATARCTNPTATDSRACSTPAGTATPSLASRRPSTNKTSPALLGAVVGLVLIGTITAITLRVRRVPSTQANAGSVVVTRSVAEMPSPSAETRIATPAVVPSPRPAEPTPIVDSDVPVSSVATKPIRARPERLRMQGSPAKSPRRSAVVVPAAKSTKSAVPSVAAAPRETAPVEPPTAATSAEAAQSTNLFGTRE